MQEYIRERCLAVGRYIAETGATVRQAAAVFGISKSSVHKDMVQRLPELDRALARRVAKVLAINLEERHIRGGLATSRKYRRLAEKTVD